MWTVSGHRVLVRSRKLQKAATSLVLSDRMEQLDCNWTDFHEILYTSVFKYPSRKFECNESLTRITTVCMKTYSCNGIWRMSEERGCIEP